VSREAGQLIVAAFNEKKHIAIKTNQLDIVTETDKQAEAHIIRAIQQLYPTHAFIGEESHDTPGQYHITDSPTWVIDPIDGTNNFVHSLPFVCVAIGVLVRREMAVAVIHAPILGETFTAIRGRGAYLTNHPVYPPLPASLATLPPAPTADSHRLSTSAITALNAAAVITELGYDRSAAGMHTALERLRLLCCGHSMQSLRSYGSCALNMCYVAVGRAEAYYEGRDAMIGPKPWDSGAAALIVRESGGCVYDTNGGTYDMCSGRVLACNNEEMARLLIDVFQQVKAYVEQ